MKYKLYISESIVSQIDEIAKELEEVSGLGKGFKEKLNERFSYIQEHPEMFPEADDINRRARMGSFHYNIFYSVNHKTKEIDIGGVFHHSRSQEYIRKELEFSQREKELKQIEDLNQPNDLDIER